MINWLSTVWALLASTPLVFCTTWVHKAAIFCAGDASAKLLALDAGG